MIELTAENFDSIIDKHQLVFIDFWASWCKPCVAFAEIYERVAHDFPSICFAKVNVEEQPVLAKDFSVRSIPTLTVIKSRVVIFEESGTMPEDVLRDLVEQAEAVEVPD